MQRLFSTFPAGRPGLGLLVLRLAVAVTLVNQGRNWLARLPDSGGGDHINSLLAAVGALKIAAAILLLAGFATPLVGVIVALGELGIAFWWMLSPYGGAGFSEPCSRRLSWQQLPGPWCCLGLEPFRLTHAFSADASSSLGRSKTASIRATPSPHAVSIPRILKR